MRTLSGTNNYDRDELKQFAESQHPDFYESLDSKVQAIGTYSKRQVNQYAKLSGATVVANMYAAIPVTDTINLNRFYFGRKPSIGFSEQVEEDRVEWLPLDKDADVIELVKNNSCQRLDRLLTSLSARKAVPVAGPSSSKALG